MTLKKNQKAAHLTEENTLVTSAQVLQCTFKKWLEDKCGLSS